MVQITLKLPKKIILDSCIVSYGVSGQVACFPKSFLISTFWEGFTFSWYLINAREYHQLHKIVLTATLKKKKSGGGGAK